MVFRGSPTSCTFQLEESACTVLVCYYWKLQYGHKSQFDSQGQNASHVLALAAAADYGKRTNALFVILAGQPKIWKTNPLNLALTYSSRRMLCNQGGSCRVHRKGEEPAKPLMNASLKMNFLFPENEAH